MKKITKNLYLRLALCILLCAAAVFICRVFYISGITPPCIFYKLTHLYCPGCGTGRAMLALLSGDFLKALSHSPLAIALLPLAFYFAAKYLVFFVSGKNLLPLPEIKSSAAGITVLVIILLFWILRNIPIFPFTILAP